MAQPVPTFYPTASRVTTGSGKEELKTVQETMELLKKVPKFVDLFEGRHKVRDEYIKQAGIELNFDFDVVKTRGKEAITFDLAKKIVLEELYRTKQIPGGQVDKKVTRHDPTTEQGRMYSVEPNVKSHVNCHASKSKQNFEKKVKMLETVDEERHEKPIGEVKLRSKRSEVRDEVKLGSKKSIASQSKIFKDVEQKKKALTWDEYILTRVSKSTARWIVSNHVESPQQKEQLKQFLEEKKIGFKKQEDLIADDESETSERLSEKVMVGKLERSVTSSATNEHLTRKFKTLYFKQNFAEENEEIKKIVAQSENKTAIIERPLTSVEPVKSVFKDHQKMSVNRSKHQFVNELLQGAQPIFITENSNEILLNTGNAYTVEKTEVYPEQKPEEISTTQGHKPRWKNIPQLKPDEKKMISADKVQFEDEDLDKQLLELDSEGLHRKLIVAKWLKLHKIGSLWHNCKIGEVSHKLSSLDSRVRLEALSVCAQAVVYRLEKLTGIPEVEGDKLIIESADAGFLPENIAALVEASLDDESRYVQFGAALTLMIQEKTTEKARKILADTIESVSATPEERFIAALVLTFGGYVDSKIANVFIETMLRTAEKQEADLCVSSLAKLSDSTKMVHCLVGEQLNSTTWKHRYLACKVFPHLKGPPNKDIIRKLVHLMWHDIDPSVRSIAAVSLGKLDLGKEVHGKLLELYKKTDREIILDAIVRTGELAIMTEKLLPHFLKCFRHDYISVRLAACNTAKTLMLKEKRILETLEQTAQFDSSDKVKAAAIDALAHIGKSNPSLAAVIIWSIRWANDLNVVKSAARAVVKLNIRNSDAPKMIQERLLSLKDAELEQELRSVMEWLGEDPSGDLEMIRTLKEEIRKQSTKDNIIRLINSLEQEDQMKVYHDRMLYSPHDQPKLSINNEELEVGNEYDELPDVDEDAGCSLEKTNDSILDMEDVNRDADDEIDSDSEFSDSDSESEAEIEANKEGERKEEEEIRAKSKVASEDDQVSRASSSKSGPPKPDFFRSLALSRASKDESNNPEP